MGQRADLHDGIRLRTSSDGSDAKAPRLRSKFLEEGHLEEGILGLPGRVRKRKMRIPCGDVSVAEQGSPNDVSRERA